jgi:hypothetical protein
MSANLRGVLVAASLSFIAMAPAQAQDGAASALSAVSALPVAISMVVPSTVALGGAALTVVAVQQSAKGTVWVLERASDGVRISVQFAGRVAAGVSTGVGTAVVVTAIASGFVLSAVGEAIAFIPNEVGASLLYTAPITQYGQVVR